MSKKYKPDLRGLSSKGKKDYPKFKKEQIETKECEICHNIKTVKKYEIYKKSGITDKGYLCDKCALTVIETSGTTLVCLDKPVKAVKKKVEKEEEEVLEFKIEDESMGDSLLL